MLVLELGLGRKAEAENGAAARAVDGLRLGCGWAAGAKGLNNSGLSVGSCWLFAIEP